MTPTYYFQLRDLANNKEYTLGAKSPYDAKSRLASWLNIKSVNETRLRFELV